MYEQSWEKCVQLALASPYTLSQAHHWVPESTVSISVSLKIKLLCTLYVQVATAESGLLQRRKIHEKGEFKSEITGPQAENRKNEIPEYGCAIFSDVRRVFHIAACSLGPY